MKQKIIQNWRSGLSVSLISVPMAISLAVASNTTPVVGIITAVWSGLIASIFGGSNFNIIGPTGSLSGVLAAFAMNHGAQTLPMLAIISGIFILIGYLVQIERYLIFIPASTIQGLTLGIATMIILGQLNFAIGLSLPKHKGIGTNLINSFKNIDQISLFTLFLFLCFFASLFFVSKILPKIPAVLVLTPFGILTGYLSGADIFPHLETLGSKFGDISVALFSFPEFSFKFFSFLSMGLTVALISILETMISAKIADGVTKTKHHPRKEMSALGLANIITGLAGGMPATAALARTALNIRSGAKDKSSQTIGSICVAVISFLFLSYFKYMPLATVAAILMFVAVRMVEREHLLRFYRHDKAHFGIALIVAFVTVYHDPIMGILFGTALSSIMFLERISHGQFDLVVKNRERGLIEKNSNEVLKRRPGDGDVLVYSIQGQLVYLNSHAHIARFEKKLLGYKDIVLRLDGVYFIDSDGVDAFNEIIESIESKGAHVSVVGAHEHVTTELERFSGAYARLKKSGGVFCNMGEALTHLGVKT